MEGGECEAMLTEAQSPKDRGNNFLRGNTMGIGMLAAGALTGGANAVGQMADDAIKKRDAQSAYSQQIAAKQNELLFQMKLKADMARQEEEASRTGKRAAIDGRLSANANEALGTRYADPIAGDTPLSPEQQAVQDEGMRRQRIEKERDRLRYTSDPENMVRAAVQEGYESPVTLLQNETKQQVTQVRAESDAARRAQAVELALAKLEGASTSKPPAGYRKSQDGNLEAIPGGPADQKLQGAFNADSAQLTGSISSFDRLAEAANAVLRHPGLDGITGLRGKLPNIPGGDAANAQALLDTLKSQVGFGVLQDMRNNSKTGGALGAVSDAEGKRLEANLAALDRAQSPEQFKQSLMQILEYSEAAKERVRGAFNLRHGDKAGGAAAGAPATATGAPMVRSKAELDALPSGTTFTAPDGSIRRKP